MIASKPFRIYVLLIAAFTLLWSFLMPTIETVVTPVSSAIPAVSTGTPGTTFLKDADQHPEKPVATTACILFFLPLLSLVRAVPVRVHRLRFAIPLLKMSLLLRPIKFTSKYVAG